MNYKNNKNNIELEDRHKITSNHTTFLERIYGFSFDTNLCSYSQIDYKGITYKTGYFLTNLIDEVCLYEILEIVINLNNLNVTLIVNEIDKDKNAILKTVLKPEDCSGPPINISELLNGDLFRRLKEYY